MYINDTVQNPCLNVNYVRLMELMFIIKQLEHKFNRFSLRYNSSVQMNFLFFY